MRDAYDDRAEFSRSQIKKAFMICRHVITVSPSSFLHSVSSLHLAEIHFACRERKTLLLVHDQGSLEGMEKGGREERKREEGRREKQLKAKDFHSLLRSGSIARDRMCNNPIETRLSIKRIYCKENRQPNSTGILQKLQHIRRYTLL